MGKDKQTFHDQKHLTISDRIYIEQELDQGTRINRIAAFLRKDPTTIAKEVKKHRRLVDGKHTGGRCRFCKHQPGCQIRGADGLVDCDRSRKCHYECRYCSRINVPGYCRAFLPLTCDRPDRSPYVCNGCEQNRRCRLDHPMYAAREAQKEYERNLSGCRKGIDMTPEDLAELDALISPLVRKGQPLSHIFAVHADEIPVCRRTIYNYFDKNVFKAGNLDLPRRVRYKRRKRSKHSGTTSVDMQSFRHRRTYRDFEFFMQEHPDAGIVEMDTVKGSRNAGKCLLTLLFRSCSFMLVILLNRCSQDCVINAINELTDLFGIRMFRKYFPVILTDNGSEFKNPWAIEKTPDGRRRTYVFYCDPYVSNQKARLEKNHEYIRYVIPKGRSMQKLKQEDINLMASHINSTARDSLNGATPFDLAALLLDKRIPALAGQFKVSPDDVMLKPALISKKHAPDPDSDR